MELRSPDPSCNPYLAIAAILGGGLDGIEKELTPPDPVNVNIYQMSEAERLERGIRSLPANLNRALDALVEDPYIASVLGEHCMTYFLHAKKEEWYQYISHVSPWEIDRYLASY